MPLLSQWINKKRTFGRQKFSFCWCGRRDLNPYVGNTRPSNVRVCRFRHSRESHYIIQHFFRFVNRFFKTFLDFFVFFEKTRKKFHFSIDFYIKLWYNTPWICFKTSRKSDVWSMLKSKIYPKSKHRLGSSPRVKIEGAQKQVWRNGRRAGFRFQ